MGLGEAYLAKRDYDKAIAAYSETIKRDPENPDHYGKRGKAYLAKGDKKRANANFAEEKKRR